MRTRNKASLYVVAEEAGVSPATVSRVMNRASNVDPETRRHVMEVAERIKFRPRNQRPRHIGMLLLAEFPIIGLFHSSIIEGVMGYCSEIGIDFSIIQITPRQIATEEDLVKMLSDRRCDGVIGVGFSEHLNVLQELMDSGLPVVAVGDRIEQPGIGYVDANNTPGIQQAMRHLIENGHKRIAMFCSTMHSADHAERLQVYKDELIAAGIAIDENLIMPLIPIPLSMKAGYMMTQKFMERQTNATAIVCMSDDLAYGVIRALHEIGIKIPEQMSVVGFDGHPTCAYTEPPLTTVRQPVVQMSRRAAEIIFAAIQARSFHTGREIFQTEFVLRGSTGNVRY